MPAGKTSVTFSSGIQGISSGAFTGCNYLTSVTVPASASTIASDAFAGSAIRSVTIPSQVTAIGSQSAWTPNVIYGYSGSTAESWADENNYVFETLDGSNSNKPDDDDPVEPDDPEKPGNGNGGSSNSGTNTTTVTAAGPAAATGTLAINFFKWRKPCKRCNTKDRCRRLWKIFPVFSNITDRSSIFCIQYET